MYLQTEGGTQKNIAESVKKPPLLHTPYPTEYVAELQAMAEPNYWVRLVVQPQFNTISNSDPTPQ